MAYTPGLTVTEATIMRKLRRLPLPGEVLVKVGDAVDPETKVGHYMIRGNIEIVDVAAFFGIEAEDVKVVMIKKVGEKVEKNEPIAMTSFLFGLFKRFCNSPIEGTIERVSEITGQVIVRGAPAPMNMNAYIPGTIVDVMPREGVVVETPAVFIQGVFGIGGETYGELHMVADSPEDVVATDQIGPECAGKIVVGGCLITSDALKKAVKVGTKGIVVGGIQDIDLIDFVGYEVGVAITGYENVGLVLILTEGFGRMKMSKKTFALLKKYDGKLACINGATQIRAGVIRPEIIIPHKGMDKSKLGRGEELSNEELRLGTPIRIIREPYFGFLGHVIALPAELQVVETESKVRVLEADLEDGRRVIVPRANVEIIEWVAEEYSEGSL